MRVVKGNKIIEITQTELERLMKPFDRAEIDLGTGDGRFVYKSAVQDKNSFYIGIDPAEKQLEDFSKKAARKKLVNVLFVSGSLEYLPSELVNTAGTLHIILPWGSLLKAVAHPDENGIGKIKSLLKKGGQLEIIFGYDPSLEPKEYQRLELYEVNQEIIENEIIPKFQKIGFHKISVEKISNQQLKKLNSTWGKKISQRDQRNLYKLIFQI